MLEIEQKYHSADFAALEPRLTDLGAGPPEEHVEADSYFNAPDRDFVRTGEAFRLRRVGEANYFTYKGPKQAGPVKTRPELEIPLPPGDESAQQFTALLTHLGFRFVAVVRKRRRSYTLRRGAWDLTVCLDEVEGLGKFAEVEVLAPPEKTQEAQEVVSALAAELGLSSVQPRSYLALFLEAQAREEQDRQPAVVGTVAELRQAVREARRRGLTVGLVPTMGALHEGHRRLIEASRSRDGFVVVSIFVNPTQFAPHEDLTRYPRPLADDLALCARAGVDLVFHPEPAEMYPSGFQTFVEVTQVQQPLEGEHRPGHFRGVATVVLKLLNATQPDRAYFGQKDAQQAAVVQRMVADLSVPVDLVVLPTVREPDGLARSSRNRYLDPGQRQQAVLLWRALSAARRAFESGQRNAHELECIARDEIARTGEVVPDYVAVVDPVSFRPLDTLSGSALLALAVRLGGTRLIDNLLLTEEGGRMDPPTPSASSGP
jgi:pantoate--beta-alanine ligase